MRKPAISVISLGCPRNVVDTEKILGRLRYKGYPITEMEEADIGIVNTCAFIKEAKEESVQVIADLIALKQQGRLKKVLVYGCLIQRYGEELCAHLPEVDAFVGCQGLGEGERRRYRIVPRHYTYLKICEGCGHGCSYCVIPHIKGRLSSRSQDDIIEEARRLGAAGTQEIVLVGQDISSYGQDLEGGESLAGLLERLLESVPTVRWFRLLYTHPRNITDELLEIIARESRVCKYLDLPLQHIHPKILRLMNRGIDREDILSLITRIRRRVPGVTLRTSLIVGFPGEGEREFRALVEFVKDVCFERLGVFTYSREEETPAFTFPRQVPPRVKKRRFDTVMRIQQKISERLNRRLLGEVMEVIIDEKLESEPYLYVGRTQADAPEVDGLIYVRSRRRLQAGQFQMVKVVDTYEYDLVGESQATGHRLQAAGLA